MSKSVDSKKLEARKNSSSSEESSVVLQWYFDQHEHVHDRFWRFFSQSVFAILFVLIVPLVYSEKIAIVPRVKWFFPLVAFVATLVSWWVLAATAARAWALRTKVNAARKRYFPEIESEPYEFNCIYRGPVTRRLSQLFLATGILLCACEALLFFLGQS